MSGLNKKSNSVHENSNKIEKTPHLKESIRKYGRNLFGALMITASLASSSSAYALHNIYRSRCSLSSNKESVILKKDNNKILKEGQSDQRTFNVDSIVVSKESRESIQKSLEFEENTFKINSAGWKEVTEADSDDPVLGKFLEAPSHKIKVNETGDVVEFLDGAAKGEQIFLTYDAFIREVMKDKKCTQEEVEKKYLMTIDEFEKKMQDKPSNSEEYKNLFDQEIRGKLAGFWDGEYPGFPVVGESSMIWLVGGKAAGFDNQEGFYMINDGNYGFSGRLLKN